MFSDFKIHRNHDAFWDELLDWLKTVCITMLFVILCFTYVGRTAIVNGRSMESTLYEDDMLILLSVGREPAQGDVVACNCEGLGEVIVKRVAAVGGQQVDIDFEAGKVYVDGKEFTVDGIENITTDSESGFEYPLTVPQGYYFVLGDNRQHSTDSRSSFVGFVSRDDILGRAVFRILPLEKFGRL